MNAGAMKGKVMEEERCCICDEPTGRAGKQDDSLYLENGQGPYCEKCWMSVCGES